MKRFLSIVSAIVIVALVMAVPATAFAAGKAHNLMGEIVSVDAKAKMLTFKDDAGENHTAPLLGAAIAESKSLKAGDKVSLTCQDSDSGEHQGIKAIKAIKKV